MTSTKNTEIQGCNNQGKIPYALGWQDLFRSAKNVDKFRLHQILKLVIVWNWMYEL